MSQSNIPRNIVFSPDGRLLTGCSYNFPPYHIVSWDFQTGGLISEIVAREDIMPDRPMIYSARGTLLGVLAGDRGTHTVDIYDVLSGTHTSSHSVGGSVARAVWTHEECLRFTTVELGSIIIWEVGFNSRQPPTKVGSLPTPASSLSPTGFLLLPTLSRIAITQRGRVLVWDARHRKILLDSVDVKGPRNTSFSPDGRLFVCGSSRPELYLWREEAPNGYVLHRVFTASTAFTTQVISPDGESIVSFRRLMVQLWRTTTSPTLSGDLIQASQGTLGEFILQFSPGEKLAAVGRRRGNAITVLDLKSGDLRFIIDTDMDICGMGMTESTVLVAGDGKVVTWDLPVGNCVLSTRTKTNTFNHSASPGMGLYISVSPDLRHVATKQFSKDLHVYDMHTGKLLAVAESKGDIPGFALDGHGVWCTTINGEVDRWNIIKDIKSDVIKLRRFRSTEAWGFPWQSPRDYQVTSDGWVLSSSGKRLLWLPPHWRSHETHRMWSGSFLALLHGELPEAVILELEA